MKLYCSSTSALSLGVTGYTDQLGKPNTLVSRQGWLL